jgi:SAM-dependent methyltransferase
VDARYDAVAEFYAEGFPDSDDEPVGQALLGLCGDVTGEQVLDLACGHGRITRQLARRGAIVTGIDLSAAMIAKAAEAERRQPAGIRYLQADAAAADWLPGAQFDAAVCSFGLSDIDDLDRTLASVARVTRPGGRFVFSILHPCFPGGQDVSGAWPTTGTYRDEGWWRADGPASSLRGQVGANHRTLSTYLNALRQHGLWLDAVLEPAPPPEWARARLDAARMPVFLAARCLLQMTVAAGAVQDAGAAG